MILNFIWKLKTQRAKNSQNNSKEEEQGGSTYTPRYQDLAIALVIDTV